MTQPTGTSCCTLRRARLGAPLAMWCGLRWLAAIVLIVATCSGAARAAITATGDVLPDPIVPLDDVEVGSSGVGSLLIDGGSTLESNYVIIGEQGVGFATVSGPGSMWSVYRGVVGGWGVGRLAVLDGAVVDTGYAGFTIGQFSEGNGAVVVDGLGSVLHLDSGLEIGMEGVGLLQIANDAIVDAPSHFTQVGTRGRVELDGGLFRTDDLTNYGTIAGQGTLQIVSSQYVENSGRIEVGTGQRLVITGGQELRSSGIISADGGEIEFTQRVQNEQYEGPGQITLRDGVIRLLPSQPWETVELRNQGSLVALGGMNEVHGEVSHQYGGQTIVTNDSTLLFHDPFELTIGDLVVHSGSTAMFLSGAFLGGDLTVSIGREDGPTPVQATGQIMVYSELHVSFAEAYTPQVGDMFPLVSATQLIGEFYPLDLPALPLGMLWQLDQSFSSIQLQIIAGLEGDYSGDGAVDAGDYTVWRDTLGSDSNLAADGDGNGVVDEGDLLVWRANFGHQMPPEELGAGAGAIAAVPEPSATVLMLVGVLLVVRRGRSAGRA